MTSACGGESASSDEQVASSPTPTAAAPLTIAFAGSSSVEQYLTLYSGPPDDAGVTASSDGLNYTVLSLGAFGKVAGALIQSTVGRPVRFLRGGLGGTTLAQWSQPKSTLRAALVAAIRAAGGADVILIQVGRNDAIDLAISGADAQIAQLRSMIASLRSEARVPNAMIFIGGSQNALGYTAEQHRQLGIQRLAEATVATTDAQVRYGYSTYDLPTIDGTHQNEASQQVAGRRFGLQVAAWIQGAVEQRGPQFSGISLVSQTQTDILFRASVGADITPATGIDGFQATWMDGGGELAINAAVRTGLNTVRLTHEARNDRLVQIGYALAHDVSDTACLRDTSGYALPAEPFLSSGI